MSRESTLSFYPRLRYINFAFWEFHGKQALTTLLPYKEITRKKSPLEEKKEQGKKRIKAITIPYSPSTSTPLKINTQEANDLFEADSANDV